MFIYISTHLLCIHTHTRTHNHQSLANVCVCVCVCVCVYGQVMTSQCNTNCDIETILQVMFPSACSEAESFKKMNIKYPTHLKMAM
jgi:hypothetical protein